MCVNRGRATTVFDIAYLAQWLGVSVSAILASKSQFGPLDQSENAHAKLGAEPREDIDRDVATFATLSDITDEGPFRDADRVS